MTEKHNYKPEQNTNLEQPTNKRKSKKQKYVVSKTNILATVQKLKKQLQIKV